MLKKIYKRYAPFRAVFKIKTLAVLFSAYPREMKHIPRNLNNNNNNNMIYIALYTKVLKRFTMEGGTGIIKTYINLRNKITFKKICFQR